MSEITKKTSNFMVEFRLNHLTKLMDDSISQMTTFTQAINSTLPDVEYAMMSIMEGIERIGNMSIGQIPSSVGGGDYTNEETAEIEGLLNDLEEGLFAAKFEDAFPLAGMEKVFSDLEQKGIAHDPSIALDEDGFPMPDAKELKAFKGAMAPISKTGEKGFKSMGGAFSQMGSSLGGPKLMLLMMVLQPIMSILQALTAPFQILGDMFEIVGGILSTAFLPITEVLAESMGGVVDITKLFLPPLEKLGGVLALLMKPIGALISQLLTALAPIFDQLIDLVIILIEPLTMVLEVIVGWEGLWNGIAVVMEWVSTVLGWVKTGLEWFVELLEKVWGWLSKLDPSEWF